MGPLLGITYDSKDDLLDVALDQLNHLIEGAADAAAAPRYGVTSGGAESLRAFAMQWAAPP
jgi:hypothetical protein